jgi:hypothetical protein
VPDVPLQAATLGAQPSADARRPVDLVIPDRDIQVPVDPVGVAEDGQMEIPPLAERAGWYRFGSSPGDPSGTAVVAAHVDSVASAGRDHGTTDEEVPAVHALAGHAPAHPS